MNQTCSNACCHDYLNIKLDENGICQWCKDYNPINFLGTDNLIKDIQEPLSRNTSKKYDCVVGFSEGVTALTMVCS